MIKVKTLLASMILTTLILLSGCSKGEMIDHSGLDLQKIEDSDLNQTLGLENCKTYFDGCNTCFVENGVIGGCTRMACEEQTKEESKCILYNNQQIIGKVLEIKENEIHILQGDIVEIFNSNTLDISKYKINDLIEVTYNQNDKFENLISEINIYENQEKEPLRCTREYMPVCAQTTIDGNGLPVLETFSNSCMAQNNQFIHDGECGDDSILMTEMRACTMEYVPVCAQFNGQPKTFGNSCGAEGLEILYEDECKDELLETLEETPTMCTMEYSPVCAEVQVQCVTDPCPPIKETFSNECMAKDNKILYEGECK